MPDKLRPHNQQLSSPRFDDPKNVVGWLGAMQAQNYVMAKWAVGMRLKSGNLQTVERALEQGEILRIHVMRPTWHFVTAEDIRWMVALSAKRIRSVNSWLAEDAKLGITEKHYHQCCRLFEKILEGHKSLTKEEIGEELNRTGIPVGNYGMTRFLMYAETEGLICSGVDKNQKPTYALLEERVPPVSPLSKEEALAKLARHYFQSHSPASLQDFIWWTGLSITEARQAINSIRPELISDRFAPQELFVHESCSATTPSNDNLHLLPSYDEYLLGYKDRSHVILPEHYAKAYNNWGIFYPVILHRGKIVGNWEKTGKGKGIKIETSFFKPSEKPAAPSIRTAIEKYKNFYL